MVESRLFAARRALASLLTVTVIAALSAAAPTSAAAPSVDRGPVTAKPAKATLKLARVDGATVVNGQPVAFVGKAPKRLVGKRVSLERASGDNGEWVRVDRAKVKSDKTFAVAGVASGVGANKWRVRVKGHDRVDQSAALATTVFGWFYLADVDMVAANRFGDAAAQIGGATYSRSMVNSSSFWYDHTAWGEWNLSYHCLTLTAAIGLDNRSATGSTVAFRSYLDGAETNHGTLGLGPAVPVTVDVSTRLRIRLESRYVAGPLGSGDTSGYGAWGDAQVLCSAPPG